MRSSFLFYGVILIMLFSFGGSIGMFPYDREMNYAFVFILVSICFAWAVNECKRWYLSVLDLCLGMFAFYVLMHWVMNNTYVEASDVCKWGAVGGTYLLVRMMPETKRLFYLVIFIGLIEAVTAILQQIGWIESQHTYFVITGHLGNPGPLGGYLAVCLMVEIQLLNMSNNSRNSIIMHFLIILFLIIGMILADSRAAWLGLIVGLLFFFAIKTRRKSLVVWGSIIIILCGIACYNYRPLSARARLLIWNVAKEMVIDKPILGHGFASYPHQYMLYQAQYFEGQQNPGEMIIADNTIYAFNEPLHLTVEMGCVGLLFALVVAVVTCWYGKNQRVALCGLLVWWTFAFFSYPVDIFPLLFIFPLLIGVVRTPILYCLNLTRRLKMVIIFICGIASILSFNQILFYGNVHKEWNVYKEMEDSVSAEKLWSCYPKLKTNVTYNVTFLRKMIMNSSERRRMDEFQQIIPNSETYVFLGKYYKRIGEWESAEKILRTATDMVPARMLPQYNLWILYKEKGDTAKAIDMAHRILSQTVKVNNSFTINARREVEEFLYTLKPSSE